MTRRWFSGILIGLIACAILVVRQTWADEQGRFFPETSHRISDTYGFQAFWDTHDGSTMLGAPLTDVVFEANTPVQYFERGRLEQRGANVVPGNLGIERTRWRTLPPNPREDTSTALFERFWKTHNGVLLLGKPLGGPTWETINGASLRVQYFERGRLEQHQSLGQTSVIVGALGREIALARGLINATTEAPAIALVDPDAPIAPFLALQPPTPTPVVPAPVAPAVAVAPIANGKVIDINISTQQLIAYENGKISYRAPIATGKDGFNTPTGTYAVYSKLPLQTMRGNLNGETWVVPDVPHVMYINGSVALHGTYWHNLFGSGIRMSHGCVNLSVDDAAWLYSWAPMGTSVVVHY